MTLYAVVALVQVTRVPGLRKNRLGQGAAPWAVRALLVALVSTWVEPVDARPRSPSSSGGGDDDLAEDDEGSGSGSPWSKGSRGPIGIGLILGEPTALTAKLLFGHNNGIQAHLGYGFGKRGRIVVIVDYLFHFVDAIAPIERAGRLAPYVGLGGRLGAREEGRNDDVLLGLRVPVGLSFLIRGAPVEIFAEVAVGIGLVPQTEAIVDGGLGGRFYF